MRRFRWVLGFVVCASAVLAGQAGQGRAGGGGGAAQAPLNLPPDTARITQLKTEAAAEVDKLKDFSQQMVDQIFSYGELGFQEFETSKYLVAVLKKNGFARGGGRRRDPDGVHGDVGQSGKPVIALGSDIDGIPQASQKPGVAYREPARRRRARARRRPQLRARRVNITAAIVMKKIMEREKIPGTIRIWPGVAEELVGAKAYLIRAGLFKDVDVALFTHVDRDLSVSWGDGGGTGLVSVQYSFKGESAHAAGNPVARGAARSMPSN